MDKQYFLNWYEKYGIEVIKGDSAYTEVDGIRIEPIELAFAIPTPTEPMEPIMEAIEKRVLLSNISCVWPSGPMSHLVFDGYLVDVRSYEKLEDIVRWSDRWESDLILEIHEKRAILGKRIIGVNRTPWESSDGEGEDKGWTSFYRRIGFGVV